MDSLFLFLIKIEAEHVTRGQIPVVQILTKLFLACGVVSLPPPDFQLDDILLSQVIDDHIGAGLVPGLRLDVIVAGSVDDGLQVQEELLPSVFFLKPVF